MDTNQNTLLKWIQQKAQNVGTDKIAIIMVILNSFFWPLAFLYGNQHNFDYGTILIVRGAMNFLSCYLICWMLGFPLDVKDSKSLKYLIIRNTIMSVHGLAVTMAQFYIPVSMVHTIAINGIIFITLLDYLLNGISINKSQTIGILVSIFGVLIVVNGNYMMVWIDPSYKFDSSFQNYKSREIWQTTVVCILLLLISFFWSYAVIVTKYIKLNPVVINFYVSFQISVTGAFNQIQTTQQKLQLSQYLWSYLFSGLLFSLSHMTFITAIAIYKKNTGILMAILNNIVIVAYLISIFRYGQTINILCVIGSTIILLGVSKLLLSKHTPQSKSINAEQKN